MYKTANNITVVCPLCGDAVQKLVYRFHFDHERIALEKIRSEHPSWTAQDGLCTRCVDYYQTVVLIEEKVIPYIRPYFQYKTLDDFVVLPIGLRLDADPAYTGKGVTICFIDSGFYPHPDIVANKNRIASALDITTGANADAAWHGTMTSVVCAGDGYECKGLYKGISPDANLVLLKVQDADGRIKTAYIIRALEWILTHHEQYNIRVVNISLSGDELLSYHESEIDRLAEQLIDKNISIVAAVGNDEKANILPPANSPRVISVGGINDENKIDGAPSAYHSTYGFTSDGLQKPELVAHAIWIAAPILPGTAAAREAEALYIILSVDGEVMKRYFLLYQHQLQITGKINYDDPSELRETLMQRIQQAKYISPNYMHVDGTSFAAPIVSSVIAQMLEANASLTPYQIRLALCTTAKKLPGINSQQQGFGVIQPRKAIQQVLNNTFIMQASPSPIINKEKNLISFILLNHWAKKVSIAGTFNHWARDVLFLEQITDGIWKIDIPLLPEGRYHYKFFVDSSRWLEDIDNPYREPDGFNGFNSLLIVDEN